MHVQPQRSHEVVHPDASYGKFLVLVGIDGSGKTSVMDKLCLPGLVTAAWRELRNHELPQMLAPEAPTEIKNRLSPLSRSMFIGGHVVAQYEYLVRPALLHGEDVLLDSYYFKLLAKEALFGTLHNSLTELCQELPKPDCVIFLDVDPAVSFGRKVNGLSPYEHFGDARSENFVHFQELLRGHVLQQLADTHEVRVVDGNRTFDVVLPAVESVIEEYRGRKGAGDDV